MLNQATRQLGNPSSAHLKSLSQERERFNQFKHNSHNNNHNNKDDHDKDNNNDNMHIKDDWCASTRKPINSAHLEN